MKARKKIKLMRSIWSIVCGALLAVWTAAPLAASAQNLRIVNPVAQRAASVPVAAQAAPASVRALQHSPAPNVIYGTIVRIAGTVLTLQTRSGRLRRIDAGPAFVQGTVSAPLFVGKPVSVEGLTQTDGVLTAARVSRVTRLVGLGPDR